MTYLDMLVFGIDITEGFATLVTRIFLMIFQMGTQFPLFINLGIPILKKTVQKITHDPIHFLKMCNNIYLKILNNVR